MFTWSADVIALHHNAERSSVAEWHDWIAIAGYTSIALWLVAAAMLLMT